MKSRGDNSWLDKPGGVRPAFSLVETVLALAVMGLAVSVLLGLLPHGLDMARKAGVAAGDARITSDILAELSQIPWEQLDMYLNNSEDIEARREEGHLYYCFFFDDQGVRIRKTEAKRRGSYVAAVELPDLKQPASETKLRLPPGQDVANLQRVVIRIAATANPDHKFETPGASYSTYVSIISRTND